MKEIQLEIHFCVFRPIQFQNLAEWVITASPVMAVSSLYTIELCGPGKSSTGPFGCGSGVFGGRNGHRGARSPGCDHFVGTHVNQARVGKVYSSQWNYCGEAKQGFV